MVKKKRQSVDVSNDTDSSEEKSMQHGAACPHIKTSVDLTKLRKAFKAKVVQLDCVLCNNSNDKITNALSEVAAAELLDDSGQQHDNTLWMCLQCGSQLCGRKKNQHALQHFNTSHSDSHALAMNTHTFSVWCYECGNEVKVDTRTNLHDCVDMIKRNTAKLLTANTTNTITKTTTNAEKDPFMIINVEEKLLATFGTIRPLMPDNSKAVPLPPAPPSHPGFAKRANTKRSLFTTAADMPDISKLDINEKYETTENNVHALPRVRGLFNLGNTCFFNAVMQCLAQTPYLLDVLKESAEPGEEFILPGGDFKFNADQRMELPMIQGTLSSWGTLTSSLAQTLEELQSGGGVFSPSNLFEKLCNKCPQFRGGDQHDSHELLRQLLESVRSEDLKRYQLVILQNLGFKGQESVSDKMRQKCKIYGSQAADRILRPDQVFRGFLVSTLTCQSCYNVSSRHEYFLDLSLPVAADKPQLPQRRKASPENTPSTSSVYLSGSSGLGVSNSAESTVNKSQLRKEKKSERKAQQMQAKRECAKMEAARRKLLELGENASDNATGGGDGLKTSSSSSYEQSDADVEDNLIDDNTTENRTRLNAPIKVSVYDTNGNNATTLPSPVNPEKRDDSPENMDKDSLDEDENDSGIATSPAYTGSNYHLASSETSCVATTNGSDISTAPINNSIMAIGLSQKSATLVRTLSAGGTVNAACAAMEKAQSSQKATTSTKGLSQVENLNSNELQQQQQLEQDEAKKRRARRAKRTRTQSHSDWSTTIAPRFVCEAGEISVQSCLNNFTGVELMTGNNKVGCENCTKNMQSIHDDNDDDDDDEAARGSSKPKTVYTNATKQFLISSPPAVLILHLKRFQLGQRCMFRKLKDTVSYPMVLDIAQFCGSKVKNLPNIDRKQKKLLYALYGIVEHAGSMCGGHYTAYVKVRPRLSKDDKRWKFIPQGSKAELDQDDEQRKKLEELLAKEKARELRLKAFNDSDDDDESASGTTSNTASADESEGESGVCNQADEAANVQAPPGKWYYVSDSIVQEKTEDCVLQAQAYLLFYERIY